MRLRRPPPPLRALLATPAMDRRAVAPALAAAACLAPCLVWTGAPTCRLCATSTVALGQCLGLRHSGTCQQLAPAAPGPGPEPEPEPGAEPEPEPEPEPGSAAARALRPALGSEVPSLPAVPPRPATDPCLSAGWPDCTSPPGPLGFVSDGFVILPQIITADLAQRLNDRLERVLRGEFDTGSPPDKSPKFNPETRVKKGKKPQALGGPSRRTLQVINIWKADTAFASVVRSPSLARFVAQLGGAPH